MLRTFTPFPKPWIQVFTSFKQVPNQQMMSDAINTSTFVWCVSSVSAADDKPSESEVKDKAKLGG